MQDAAMFCPRFRVVLYCFRINLLNFCLAVLQIMWAGICVEKKMSLPVATSGEGGEQSVIGESHTDDSDLVRSEAIRDVDTVQVYAPEKLIVLSCDASSQMSGCVGCKRLKEDI